MTDRLFHLLPRLIIALLAVVGTAALMACGGGSTAGIGDGWDDSAAPESGGGDTGNGSGTGGGGGSSATGGSGGYGSGGSGGSGGYTGGSGGAGGTGGTETGGTGGSTPENWIQLSTDDSTSMASAQMYKADFPSDSLKSHEFVNYYDPPGNLFDAEPWSIYEQIGDNIELGMKAEQVVENCAPPCEEPGIAEVLFEMRAERITKATRRNWNVFLCVDVSGSMWGDKMEFVRDALDTMLIHFKEGDHLTLITFDSIAHDVFIDLEFAANESTIRTSFAALEAGSSTNMIAGLNRTYDLAQQKYDVDLLQRVVLFSDGNANVGDTDIDTYAGLTRINGQEGIYLSGVGVGYDYDWDRMDQLTDAGKGAHVFLPDSLEVDLIFGDYFNKIIEVAADQVAIEMVLPEGITLESFSGEEVSTDPNARLQNIVLAAGDDMTFIARFEVADAAALAEPASLKVTLRPLTTGQEVVVERDIAAFSDLFADPGQLFERTRIITAFGKWASGEQPTTPTEDIDTALLAYGTLDWGLIEVDALLP